MKEAENLREISHNGFFNKFLGQRHSNLFFLEFWKWEVETQKTSPRTWIKFYLYSKHKNKKIEN